MGIWTALSALIALFIGGLTTGRLAGVVTRGDGACARGGGDVGDFDHRQTCSCSLAGTERASGRGVRHRWGARLRRPAAGGVVSGGRAGWGAAAIGTGGDGRPCSAANRDRKHPAPDSRAGAATGSDPGRSRGRYATPRRLTLATKRSLGTWRMSIQQRAGAGGPRGHHQRGRGPYRNEPVPRPSRSPPASKTPPLWPANRSPQALSRSGSRSVRSQRMPRPPPPRYSARPRGGRCSRWGWESPRRPVARQ